MNFVADESCAMTAIRALSEAGHNVLAIAEIAKGDLSDPSNMHLICTSQVPRENG